MKQQKLNHIVYFFPTQEAAYFGKPQQYFDIGINFKANHQHLFFIR